MRTIDCKATYLGHDHILGEVMLENLDEWGGIVGHLNADEFEPFEADRDGRLLFPGENVKIGAKCKVRITIEVIEG